ncbi:hypothetical protein MPER_07483, partial [Moniliophthora perniciosa FA553]
MVADGSERATSLRSLFTTFSDRFEVVEIADISRDQVGDALKGVWAVIHLAYYAPRKDEKPEEMINGTINGSLNIIKQAEAAGAKHVVVTGSVAAVHNPQGTYKHDDWNPTTKEEAISSGDFLKIYSAAKKYSELAIWEWAEAHPHVEVTTSAQFYLSAATACKQLHTVYGPWAKGLVLPTPNFAAMTPTFWNLIKPDGAFTLFPGHADVRDVAKAHLGAITHPVPTSQIGRKRL